MTNPRYTQRVLPGLVAVAVLATAAGYAGSHYFNVFSTGHAAVPAAAATVMHQHGMQAVSAAKQGDAEAYTCPMHPEVVQDHPGTCPICGMTLVKMQQAGDHAGNASPLVHVDEATQQRMGVRMESAAVTNMHKEINAFATISPDESRTVFVNPKVEGWIRHLHVQGVGQAVHKGQVLYEIYSPELQQRQRDYVDLLTRREALLGSSMELVGPNSAMLGSLAKERFRARERLLAADIPLDVVEELEKSRRISDVIPVRAAQDGVVGSIAAREGSYVNPMQTVLVYTDSRRVWAEITLFPDQVSWLKSGDVIVLTSGLDKTVQIRAKIDLSTLQIDAASRAAKLRLPLENSNQAFRAGAFAEAVILSSARKALSVPRDALIRTGHGDFLVVGQGQGHFSNTAVKTGIEDKERVEILGGLKAGQQVAVNAQFLLDAAGSLQAMQQRQLPPGSGANAAVVASPTPESSKPGMDMASGMHMHAGALQ
ncbi:efflux RND transporter periplasmic adaptor subunit [Undibacterium sp. TJN25]|uniref:efflux RND transporter periplasmic adaptor subunit n=1 Tax=Undibacterium sp. TJN25 TaxID=3413056 RepID=UPI003BF3477F